MHEQSLIRSLLLQVEAIRREHGGQAVTEVCAEIGPLSGVEPLLLASAFEQLAVEQTVAGATLRIDEVELLARCDACDTEFEVIDFVFRCIECNGNVKVIRGDAVQIVSVSVRSDGAAGFDSAAGSSGAVREEAR